MVDFLDDKLEAIRLNQKVYQNVEHKESTKKLLRSLSKCKITLV